MVFALGFCIVEWPYVLSKHISALSGQNGTYVCKRMSTWKCWWTSSSAHFNLLIRIALIMRFLVWKYRHNIERYCNNYILLTEPLIAHIFSFKLTVPFRLRMHLWFLFIPNGKWNEQKVEINWISYVLSKLYTLDTIFVTVIYHYLCSIEVHCPMVVQVIHDQALKSTLSNLRFQCIFNLTFNHPSSGVSHLPSAHYLSLKI